MKLTLVLLLFVTTGIPHAFSMSKTQVTPSNEKEITTNVKKTPPPSEKTITVTVYTEEECD